MTPNTWYPLGRFSAAKVQSAVESGPAWEVHDTKEDRFMVATYLEQFSELLNGKELAAMELDIGETVAVGGYNEPLFYFYRVV